MTTPTTDLPLVYAARTDWNERILSILSSITFTTVHRPKFLPATKQRLPHSVEVQHPTSPHPIVLVVVSCTCKFSGDLDYFLELAQQSTAFVVFHQRISETSSEQKRRHQFENTIKFCQSTRLPTFLIVHGDVNWEWSISANEESNKLNQTYLYGVISVSGEPETSSSTAPPPPRTQRSLSRAAANLDDAISYLRIQLGGANLVLDHVQNPRAIDLVARQYYPSTAPVWLARTLFKYIFAVVQLRQDPTISSTRRTPRSRL